VHFLHASTSHAAAVPKVLCWDSALLCFQVTVRQVIELLCYAQLTMASLDMQSRRKSVLNSGHQHHSRVYSSWALLLQCKAVDPSAWPVAAAPQHICFAPNLFHASHRTSHYKDESYQHTSFTIPV
jgi:hypothetical protein